MNSLKRLKDLHVDVPDGWYYDVPETSFRVQSSCYNFLLFDVIDHLEANKLDVPRNIDLLVQHQIACRVPDSFVKQGKP